MASSVEVFASDSIQHTRSLSLGIMDEGSLTWFDRLVGGIRPLQWPGRYRLHRPSFLYD